METMEVGLSVVKESFFGPPGQYGRLVTRANSLKLSFNSVITKLIKWLKLEINQSCEAGKLYL